MPKLMRYLQDSIVFFEGDDSEYIYLLKEGTIRLDFHNIETGKEEFDVIFAGEFFGVKSVLSRCPREETATVLKDARVICFKLDEFQTLAQSNIRLILKMMKIYSTQLRKGHKQLSNLMESEEVVDAETGLYMVAKHYMASGKRDVAIYAFKKYYQDYPMGKYVNEVQPYVGKEVELSDKELYREISGNFESLKWKQVIDQGIEFIKKFQHSEYLLNVLYILANANFNIGKVENARSLIAKIRTMSPDEEMQGKLDKFMSKLE